MNNLVSVLLTLKISIVLINCHLTGLSFLTTQRYKYVLLVIKKHKISNINIQDVL